MALDLKAHPMTATDARGERPVRLQLSRKKGFDLQAHSRAVNGLPAVKVDRTTSWGNPYRPGDELAYGPFAGSTVRDTAHAVEIFEEWARYAIAGLSMPQASGDRGPTKDEVARSLAELRGRNLACWCGLCPAHAATGKPLDITCSDCAPCHADVLLRLANTPVCDAPTAPATAGGQR